LKAELAGNNASVRLSGFPALLQRIQKRLVHGKVATSPLQVRDDAALVSDRLIQMGQPFVGLTQVFQEAFARKRSKASSS
jgi:hypothetical protein